MAASETMESLIERREGTVPASSACLKSLAELGDVSRNLKVRLSTKTIQTIRPPISS